MSRNVILTDVNEEQILPITTSENVFLNPDMTLREYIEHLNAGGSAFVLPVATADRLGGVKVGAGLAIADDGTLYVTASGVSYEGVHIGGDVEPYTLVEEV